MQEDPWVEVDGDPAQRPFDEELALVAGVELLLAVDLEF